MLRCLSRRTVASSARQTVRTATIQLRPDGIYHPKKQKPELALWRFLSLALLLGLCWVGTGVGTETVAHAQVVVKSDFVPRTEIGERDTPDPAKLSDIVRIKADADSKAGIDKITFEVDDQFRFEAKQPPFVFNWDTLDENDGVHTIAITAYNVNGQTGVKRIKVTVENNLKAGIPYFVKQGLAAFAHNDLLTLDKVARKGFKISRIDYDSVRLMALNRGAHGDPGGGFGLLDDQQIGVPKDDAFTLRVRGYLMLFQGMNEGDNVRMCENLEKGFTTVRQQMRGELANLSKTYPEDSQDPAGQVARGDILFNQHNYDGALAAYEKSAKLAQSRTDKRRAQHRVCMALLRSNRVAEAETFAMRLNGSTDATDTTRGLMAAVLFQKRKYVEAREMARQPANDKNLVALSVASLSDLATGARLGGMKLAREATNIADIPETQYVLAAALGDSGDFEGAKRSFRSGFLRAPFFGHLMVEFAWETMAYENSNERYAHSLNLLDLVLATEPDNAEALAARTTAMLQLGRFQAAQPVVAQLAGQDPLAPDTAILKAITVSRGNGSHAAIKPALEFAQKTDPTNYKETFLPPLTTLIPRFARLRRIAPLTPDLLDAAEGMIQIASN